MEKLPKINVIFEDNHLLVVEKPVNIPVQEDSSKDIDLLTILKNYIKERQKLDASAETVDALLTEFRALEEDYINQLTDKIESYREENNLNE